jgi:hypothetical protein
MEEANPVGKVEINLKEYMAYPKVDPNEPPDRLPKRRDFSVDLVPRLADLHQGEVRVPHAHAKKQGATAASMRKQGWC